MGITRRRQSTPTEGDFRDSWALAGAMETQGEEDCEVQCGGEPLVYENTLGSSLTSATDRLLELEPISTSVHQNSNAFHIHLTWFCACSKQ